MFRPLSAAALLVALSALAGCAGSAQHAAVEHSLASQVPTEHFAAAPPTDFEFEFAPAQPTAPRRFTKDSELTGSLHAASPTHTSNE